MDAGFQILTDPQVADASKRMANGILGWSLILALLFAGAVAAIPI